VSHEVVKYGLLCLVFADRRGNLVMVDPRIEKQLGLPDELQRFGPFVAATEAEIEWALEEVLDLYQRYTKVTSRHIKLVEAVQEARARRPALPH